jgi:hypothetical protein
MSAVKPCADFYVAAVADFLLCGHHAPLTKAEEDLVRSCRGVDISTLSAARLVVLYRDVDRKRAVRA